MVHFGEPLEIQRMEEAARGDDKSSSSNLMSDEGTPLLVSDLAAYFVIMHFLLPCGRDLRRISTATVCKK